MVTESLKAELRSKLALIKSGMPGFRSRPGQMMMIAEVAKVFSRCPDPVGVANAAPATPLHAIGLFNGGTGVGKSLGYFLPGIVLARGKNKKLVISSSTVALQEQLVTRDLPAFSQLMGIPVKIEIAKGRTRYVCKQRLTDIVIDPKLAQPKGDAGAAPMDMGDATRLATAMVQAYDAATWNGDRDTWHGKIDERFWTAVTTDRLGCPGKHCPHHADCAQVAARARVKQADVIVANHDLVLADLLSGGRIIAPAEECFFVFDEAHHLPERAVSAFATSHFLGSGRNLPRRVERFIESASPHVSPHAAPACSALAIDIGTLGRQLSEAYGFFANLAQLRPTESRPQPTIEFDLSCTPDLIRELGDNIINACKTSAGQLEIVGSSLASNLDNSLPDAPAIRKLLIEAWQIIGRLLDIQQTWELFVSEPPIEQPPIAKWVEAVQRRGKTDYRMCASPVVAGEHLRSLLFDKAAGVILASANLTTMGRFDNCLRDTGLIAYGAQVVCIDIPSPFNYREQAVLDIPHMQSNPKCFDDHSAEVTAWLANNVSDGTGEGTLVLFASRRQMIEVASRIPATLRGRVLMQGEMSKADILREHVARVDAGQSPVIFGLESFGEGVDLRGKYCTHVIEVKLPFSVPNEPVLKALAGWLKRSGGDPFIRLYVPMAARKLEQHCGRLIRTETDHGRISVLDPRLWKSSYGRTILRGLPPFRLTVAGREVRVN